MLASFASASFVRSDTDAAESINAVSLFLFGGLLHVGESSSMIGSRLLTSVSPPGRHLRSFPFGLFPKPALIMLPPIGLLRVALFWCPGLSLNLHVALWWLPFTLYPHVQ